MQKQIMMLVVALALGAGYALPAMGQEFELVGYTTVVRNGAQGVLVYNEDCDNAFPGVGARVCTSGDLMRGNLPDRPPDPTPNATNWILPTIVGNSTTSLIDASGIVATGANLTCNAFASASASFTGLTANDRGVIVLAGCNGSRSVACCAPPAVP
jgi:hypothetical protein